MKTVSAQVVICCVYELCRTCKATFYTCLTFWANLFAHLLLPKSSMDSRTRRRNQHTTAIKFPTPICTVSIFLSLFKIFTHNLSFHLSIYLFHFVWYRTMRCETACDNDRLCQHLTTSLPCDTMSSREEKKARDRSRRR